ncbi:ATP-binding protein [Sphingomonas sp. GC_Shp_3]|uniref:ATP-binding protein n=1 Tax=Sphingomonas sp. GC_Shp_3 TaxID=2937383 RepID=UPI00226AEE49|nr:ATP-binding protein [Sphingomonas sp. GC_Shp_3]
MATNFTNPFKPGAGHMPPYLAGRGEEEAQFRRLLSQTEILENLVLTGLRGVGKTVLLETFKPLAIKEGWLWVGTDLSEAVSVSEQNLALRIMTDLAAVTSAYHLNAGERAEVGFGSATTPLSQPVNFKFLASMFDNEPGLVTDKLKAVLEFVWTLISTTGRKGIVFAYDEAQNLSDNAQKEQFPLSVLLDVFQSIQRKGIPFMLALSGLPTLFPKLVDARTFAERMFRVVSLHQLSRSDCEAAITRPVADAQSPISFSAQSVAIIAELSGGYPYFIQFICREVYDLWIQRFDAGDDPGIPIVEITRKLDTDFFAGRWAKATDRQRALMWVISNLENCDAEFSVQEIVVMSDGVLEKPFTSSHANQILATLAAAGLIYKNRHGKYMFAVPLMSNFVRRQSGDGGDAKLSAA